MPRGKTTSEFTPNINFVIGPGIAVIIFLSYRISYCSQNTRWIPNRMYINRVIELYDMLPRLAAALARPLWTTKNKICSSGPRCLYLQLQNIILFTKLQLDSTSHAS